MTKSDKTGFEIPDQMREMADQSVEQARKAFDEYMATMRKTIGSVEESAKTVKAGADDFSRTALEYTEEHVAAAFDLAQKMVRAEDPQQMLQLQGEYMRKQMEALGEQVRDLGDKASKTAQQASKAGKP
ncbi:phasin [Stappia sp.]|uniref:phasin n=1 Tax=Stappia sp. TaxID=1870903 RepID=UPI0032D9AD09